MTFKGVPSKKKQSRFEKETEDMAGTGGFSPQDIAERMKRDRRGERGPQKNKKGKGSY